MAPKSAGLWPGLVTGVGSAHLLPSVADFFSPFSSKVTPGSLLLKSQDPIRKVPRVGVVKKPRAITFFFCPLKFSVSQSAPSDLNLKLGSFIIIC